MPHGPQATADCRVRLHQTASAGRRMTRLVPPAEPQEGRAPSHADSRLFSPSPRPLRNRQWKTHGPSLSSAWLLPASVRISDRTSDRHKGVSKAEAQSPSSLLEIGPRTSRVCGCQLTSLICSLVRSERVLTIIVLCPSQLTRRCVPSSKSNLLH